jgi:hypothetical protein
MGKDPLGNTKNRPTKTPNRLSGKGDLKTEHPKPTQQTHTRNVSPKAVTKTSRSNHPNLRPSTWDRRNEPIPATAGPADTQGYARKQHEKTYAG